MRRKRLLVGFLMVCLFFTGCSLPEKLDWKKADLSPENAPKAMGAVLHTVSLNSDGITVYRYRAWKPIVELELQNKQECLMEIENVPADKLQVFFEGKKGQTTPDLVGIELQIPRSTLLAISVPKGLQGKVLLEPPADWGEGGSFAVIGDTQGNNEAFQTAIKQINMAKPDFVVHLGDLTASGREEEITDFLKTSNELFCPLYSVPGNHDAKSGRITVYEKWLASLDYSFDWGGESLVFLDNSAGTLTSEQLSYLGDELNNDRKTLLFMHMPAVDPRGESEDHTMTDRVAIQSFLTLLNMQSQKIWAVFNGHIHLYDQYLKNSMQFVTSGGGGAELYAEASEGGYYHWLLVRDPDERSKSLDITVEKFDPSPRRDIVTLIGTNGTLVLDSLELKELYASNKLEADSSFQNQYGNINGQGTYAGIPIRSLLKEVGGMTEGDILTVYSSDGYQQTFAYGNVYPEKVGWQEKQGEMILALSFNGQELPKWNDGYRVAFLTSDGLYDNKDCEMTSVSGEGWNEYQSAGARWIRYVVKMEVK